MQRAEREACGNVDSKDTREMNFKDRLKELSERGYRCDYLNASHRPLMADGKTAVDAVYLENHDGRIPQQIFMASDTGLVIVVGTREDYAFEDFLSVLDGVDVAPVVKTLSGQRSLWEDEA